MKNKKKIFGLITILFVLFTLLISSTAYCAKVALPLIPNTAECKHSGGTATCTKKAVCSKCGEEYGDYGSHKRGTFVRAPSNAVHIYKCSVCESNISETHTYSLNSDESSHWEECSWGSCAYVKNKSAHSFDSKGKCSICGKTHTHSGTYQKNSTHHWKTCSCGYTIVSSTKHTFGTDNECDICGYKTITTHKHYFSALHSRCKYTGCEEVLTVESCPNIEKLPYHREYGVTDGINFKHIHLSKDTITLSHIPYANAEGTELLEVSLYCTSFSHGTYRAHAKQYEDLHPGQEWQESKNETFGDWNDKTWFAGNKVTLKATGSGKTFQIDASNLKGHWLTGGITVGNGSEYTGRMFVNGSCSPYNPITSSISEVYRDINGNPITGAPTDIKNKEHEGKYNYSVNLKTLDDLGWRYVGHIIDKKAMPTNLTANRKTATSGSTTVGKGENHYIVYIFEPVKLTIRHEDVAGNIIPTSLNQTLNLKDYIGRPEELKAKTVSLNKGVFPNYTLINYELSNATKTLLDKDFDASDERIRSEVVDVLAVDTKEKDGYKTDMLLVFVYTNSKVLVQFFDYETNAFLKSTSGKNLSYEKGLSKNVTIESLITPGQNELINNGQTLVYDISEKVLKKIEVIGLNNNKVIKDIDLQSDEIDVTTLQYLILNFASINSIPKGLFDNSDVDKVIKMIEEVMNSGKKLTINFYYKDAPLLTVKHYDEQDNKLLPNEYIHMIKEETETSSADLKVWTYYYKEYEIDGIKEDNAIREDELSDIRKVMVPYTDEDREIKYIYSKIDLNSVPKDGVETNEEVILRSNKRDKEEYNIEISIPTSEDLYANVITDRFLLTKSIDNKLETAKLKITLVQPYIENGQRKEISSTFDAELEYYYLCAEDVQLNILSKAIVKNPVTPEITVKANYESYPELIYIKGGELSKKSGTKINKFKNLGNNTYSLEYKLDEVSRKVTMSDLQKQVNLYKKDLSEIAKCINAKTDTLKVVDMGKSYTILPGVSIASNGEIGIISLGKNILNLNPTPIMTSRDILYKYDNIYINRDTLNGTYGTVADIYYKPYKKVENTHVIDTNDNRTFKASKDYTIVTEIGSEILISEKQNVKGNDVVIHTPVVNNTKITELFDSKESQWIEETKEKYSKDVAATLILGKEFKLTIPNDGAHINIQGYKTKDYNYNGLAKEDGTLFDNAVSRLSFAKGRQVKFSFGVIFNKVYRPANEWIDLEVSSTEDFFFIIPEWEKELWKTGKHTIETRVIAENCADSLLTKTEVGANKNSSNYVAVQTLKVNLIGELLDLEIRATNDPSYSNYKTEGSSGMPIGQYGQANAGKAYQYGLKLGVAVYFDITSTGWTGDTTEQVNLTPKYYFVSKAGGTATPVDLYYRQQGVSGYVSLKDKPRDLTTIMSADAVKGSRTKSRFASLVGTTGFFNANAGVEMSNTTKLIPLLRKEDTTNYLSTANKNVVNYGVQIKTGTTKLVTLPYTVRLAYTNAVNAMLSEKYKEVSGLEIVSENVKNYCIGHWYGAFKIPASTVAVNPGETPKPDKSNTKKDGYIIVSFEEIKSGAPGGTPYLEVDPDRFAQEGADTDFTLPNGKPAKTPELVPAIIYESNLAINQDLEVGGTH